MIVDPVPTGPHSGRRRAAARLGIALPGLLLAAVIGLGMLGQAAAPGLAPATVGRGSPHPAASVGSAAGADQPATLPPPTGAGFPDQIDGLPVLSIPEVLATRQAGGELGIIALAGYLGVIFPPTDCRHPAPPPLDALGPLCERTGLMALSPWSLMNSDGFSGIGPHVHPLVPIGVRLPDGIAGTTITASGAPRPAVVIGTFDPLPATGCSAATVPCDVGFTLAAVAWIDGAPFPPEPVVDAGHDRTPIERSLGNRRLAEAAIPAAGAVILGSALVRPATLARIDRAALAAVRSSGSRPRLVWYVWAIDPGDGPVHDPPGGSPRRLAWAVMDDTTGAVLATGQDSGRHPAAVGPAAAVVATAARGSPYPAR